MIKLFITIFIFLISASFVNADFSTSKDNKKMVIVEIKKGWNLVPSYMGLVDQKPFAVSPDISPEEIFFPTEDPWRYPQALFYTIPGNLDSPKLAKTFTGGPYILDPINKKYFINVDFWGGWKKFSESQGQELYGFFNKIGVDNNLQSNYLMSGEWIYSTEELKLVREVGEDFSIDPVGLFGFVNKEPFNGVQLYSGWNLFAVTPDLLGKNFSGILGDCKILKAGIWDASSQKWGVLDMGIKEEYDYVLGGPSAPFASVNIGMVEVLKVEKDCKLSFKQTEEIQKEIEPPGLP